MKLLVVITMTVVIAMTTIAICFTETPENSVQIQAKIFYEAEIDMAAFGIENFDSDMWYFGDLKQRVISRLENNGIVITNIYPVNNDRIEFEGTLSIVNISIPKEVIEVVNQTKTYPGGIQKIELKHEEIFWNTPHNKYWVMELLPVKNCLPEKNKEFFKKIPGVTIDYYGNPVVLGLSSHPNIVLLSTSKEPTLPKWVNEELQRIEKLKFVELRIIEVKTSFEIQ